MWLTTRDQPRLAIAAQPVVLVLPFLVGERAEASFEQRLFEEVHQALDADTSLRARRGQSGSGATVDAEAHSAAGQRAGAHYVVAGHIGWRHDTTEIALRLVRAADGSTAWSGTFWRSPSDLVTVGSDLAAVIAEAIHLDQMRLAQDNAARARR